MAGTHSEGLAPRRLPAEFVGLKIDPLILEAVADVDRSLLAWSLSLTVRERLRACTKTAGSLVGFRSDKARAR